VTLLNQAQRDRETAIATRITDLLVANCRSATDIVPTEIILHVFGIACEEENFVTDEGSARRILHGCAKQLKERRAVAGRLNEFLLTSTEEILEARAKAKEDQRAAKYQQRGARRLGAVSVARP
jgi:hypothetical protein